MMVVQTRKSIDPSNARPNRKQRLENAALRSHVRKSIEKAQQEEAFKELIKAMASNGGKANYGAIKKIHIHNLDIQIYIFKEKLVKVTQLK